MLKKGLLFTLLPVMYRFSNGQTNLAGINGKVTATNGKASSDA